MMTFLTSATTLLGVALFVGALIWRSMQKSNAQDAKNKIMLAGLAALFIFPSMPYWAPFFGFQSITPSGSSPGGATQNAPAGVIGLGTCSNGEQAKPISILTVQGVIKNSGDRSTADVDMMVYEEGDNPSSPLVNPIAEIDLSSGSANYTGGLLYTCTNYVVVIDGETTYYDKDLGTTQFVYGATTDASSVPVSVTIKDITAFSTLSSLLATDASTWGNAASEVENDSTTITYNETAGDGTYDADFVIGVTGAYTETQGLVLCFEFDQTNAPEGDEYSSIQPVLQDGPDLHLPSELIEIWSSQGCVQLGLPDQPEEVTATSVSKYTFTFVLSEANSDSNDDFKMILDDLGEPRGQDVLLGRKATLKSIAFDVTS